MKDNIKTQERLDYYEKKYISKHLGKEKCLNIDEGGLFHEYIDRTRFFTIEEDGTYRYCWDENTTQDETKEKKYHFDKTTNELIKKLKKNKHDWELRKELLNNLLRYHLTPSLLNI